MSETRIQRFEFSPFAENTYVLYDDSGECALIDPGCYTEAERATLRDFVRRQGLRPTLWLNTHAHLDHVFGAAFVAREWGLGMGMHEGEMPVLQSFDQVCAYYGIPDVETPPPPTRFIADGEELRFGNTRLQALLTSGHSPASLSFYCAEADFVLSGDVLFYGSIGRTDLPGGDLDTLLESVRTRLFTLPPHTMVYPGHGEPTTIRFEMEYNPFF